MAAYVTAPFAPFSFELPIADDAMRPAFSLVWIVVQVGTFVATEFGFVQHHADVGITAQAAASLMLGELLALLECLVTGIVAKSSLTDAPRNVGITMSAAANAFAPLPK